MTPRSFPALAAASLTLLVAVSAPAAEADGYVATVLPSNDAYIDSGNATSSYPGKTLHVGFSPASSTKKLALLQFDLGEIPGGSVVDSVQLVLTADPPGLVSQTVKVTVVEDFNWPSTMTYDWANQHGITTVGAAPCSQTVPTSCLAGTWTLYQLGNDSVPAVTNQDNPALVAAVADANTREKRMLSVMLSTESSQKVNVPYSSTTTATANELYGHAPRLLVRYSPPPALLARDWAQPQGNWRHGGGTPWKFAQSPATAGITPDLWKTNGAPSNPVIYHGDIYAFVTSGNGKTLTRFTRNGNSTPLSGTMPAGTVSIALGPLGKLFAATNGTLALFDLNKGGEKLGEVTLDDFNGSLTVGPSGGVYLLEKNGKQVSAFILKGSSSPSLQRSWSHTLPSGKHPTAVTLSADGSLAYVANDASFTAMCSASVSAPSSCQAAEKCKAISKPLWSYTCTGSGCSPKIPVAADDGHNTVYLASGKKLLAFQCTGYPLQNSIGTDNAHNFEQPVLTKDDVLVAAQDGQFYAVVTKQGSVYQAETNCLLSGQPSSDCSEPKAITASQLPKATKTAPVLDGNNNLYILDDTDNLSAYALTISNGDPALAQTFAPVTATSGAGSLTIGPNGTLYASNSEGITALEPKTPKTVTVKKTENGTAYRASKTLTIEAGVPTSSTVILQSDGTINFNSPPTGQTYSVPSGSAMFAVTGGSGS